MAFTAVATKVYKDPLTTVYLNSLKQNDDMLITGAVKAWGVFDSSGTLTSLATQNISSVTDSGVGSFTITFTTGFTNSNYCVWGIGHGQSPNQDAFRILFANTTDTGSCKVFLNDRADSHVDTDYFNFLAVGLAK